MSATDVCAITGRPKNSMSRAIGLLLDKGLVEREADGEDGRRKPSPQNTPGITRAVRAI
ncbi:MAG: MarR family transcriptional regulator [Xanthobacteraceae bacterium]